MVSGDCLGHNDAVCYGRIFDLFRQIVGIVTNGY